MRDGTKSVKKALHMPAVREILMHGGIFFAFAAAGRAALPDGLMPFAPAAAAAAWICGLPMSALLGCLAGVISCLAWDTVLSLTVFSFAAWGFSRLSGRVVRRQVLLAVLLGELVALFAMRSVSPLDGLLGCLSAACALLLTGVYAGAVETAKSLRLRKLLSEEEVISLCIAAGTLLLGMVEAEVYGLSLPCILGGVMTMMLAVTGGAGAGGSTGIALGVMLAIGGKGSYIAQLGLCGLVAGGLHRLGKAGSAAGYAMAAAAMTVYSRGDAMPLLNGLLSAVLFLFVPARALAHIGRFVNASLRRERNRQEYLHRLREMTGERLREFGSVFQEMGELFAAPCHGRESARQEHPWPLEALRPICAGCPAENRCWSDLARLRDEMEQTMEGEVPWRLTRCKRIDALCATAKALLDAEERQIAQRERAEKFAAMAGGQLCGLSAVVEELAQKLDKEVRFDDVLEAQLLQKLDAEGTDAKDVVAQLSGGRLTVTVEGRRCTNQCSGRMRAAVSAACGKSMRLASRDCAGCCRVVYEEARQLDLSAGIASRAKGEVCGDTAVAEGLPDGKFLIALSDGMGSGTRAKKESGDAIALLAKLYHAGVDRGTAMECVNRLMMLRAEDEMYSTMDCCCVDLVDGHAEFAKLGAAPSVWLHAGGVQVLRGESLPAGIVKEAEAALFDGGFRAGDWLILVSDGVSDVLGEDLGRAAASYACGDPHSAALCLLEYAAARGANDDMTVVAVRMEEGRQFPNVS